MGTARPYQTVPPALDAREHEESFAVMDAGNTALAFIYFEEEAGRRSSMKRLSREDDRRLATQVVRLPELLEELRLHRAARDAPS
jgi:hypothetical protein